jgi:copper chaperone
MTSKLVPVSVQVSGMHCGACVRRLTTALTALPGVSVQSVEVGNAQVSYDPALTSVANIAAAVKRTGFSVTE